MSRVEGYVYDLGDGRLLALGDTEGEEYHTGVAMFDRSLVEAGLPDEACALPVALNAADVRVLMHLLEARIFPESVSARRAEQDPRITVVDE